MEAELARLLEVTPQELAAVPVSLENDVASDGKANISLPPDELAKLAEIVDKTLTELASVEKESQGFQNDIQQLSSEIKLLQERSQTLHTRLEVRHKTISALGPLVEHNVVPPAIVKEIISGEINAQWRASLAYLLRTAKVSPASDSQTQSTEDESAEPTEADSLEQGEQRADDTAETGSESQTQNGSERDQPTEESEPSGAAAADPPSRASISTGDSDFIAESASFTAKLLARAALRIKDYYISCIRRIRRPGIDAQVVQNDLVNNKALFAFLHQSHPKLAQTIRQAYLNTIKWYYHLLLGKYLRVLDRQPVQIVDKTKVIGSAGTATQKSIFTSASTAKSTHMFNIGARPTILTSNDPALSLAAAPPSTGYNIEVLTRSILLVLEDSITMENLVLTEAFGSITPDGTELAYCFQENLLHAQNIITRLTIESYDIYGLILTLKFALNGQKAPAIFQEFCKEIVTKLESNVRAVLDANSKSIEVATGKPSQHRAAEFSGPHPLTSLVAGFLTGIMQIYPAELEDSFSPSIRHFASVFEMFITKISSSTDAMEMFLFNNYFVVAAMLSDVQGNLASELAQHFKLLADVYDPSRKS